uniref:G patch domain-containing protein 11 n=1 Tax=Cacopsylla melanoneura TaxID=428564 RepID=A0A8D8R9P5_9HEMI
MSSDSEEDYMSMDFTSAVENDVRPGLLQTNRQKREFELLKRKQEFDVKSKQCKKKDLKVLEEEHREEGLNKPIEEGNKGFALLAKMGYKAGGGIGKQDKPTALIDIKIKTSRKGLGLEEQRPRRKHSSTLGRRIPRPDQLSVDRLSDYRQQLSERLGEKKLEGDLRRAQKICVEFDRNIGVEEPGQWWFWPPDELDTNNEEELEALSTRNNEENESEDDEYIKQVDILVENDKNDTSCKPDESCTSKINENERRKDDQREHKTNDLNKYIELVGNLVRKEHKEMSE